MTAEDLRTFFDGMMPYTTPSRRHCGRDAGRVKTARSSSRRAMAMPISTRKPVIADQTLFRPGSVSSFLPGPRLCSWSSRVNSISTRTVNTYLDFKVPRSVRAANHAPQHHDAHLRLRRERERTLPAEAANSTYALDWPVSPEAHAQSHLFLRARSSPTPTTRPRSRATSCSACPAKSFSTAYVGQSHLQAAQDEQLHLRAASAEGGLDNMAKGYKQASDPKPQPYEIVEAAPAGSLASTATDMAFHDGAPQRR